LGRSHAYQKGVSSVPAHVYGSVIGQITEVEAAFAVAEPEIRARNNVRLLDAIIQVRDGIEALRAACSGALLVRDDDKDTLPS